MAGARIVPYQLGTTQNQLYDQQGRPTSPLGACARIGLNYDRHTTAGRRPLPAFTAARRSGAGRVIVLNSFGLKGIWKFQRATCGHFTFHPDVKNYMNFQPLPFVSVHATA
ncbi:hypothetical protein AB0D04_05930 [Streptomyces sp. NPDC048483]|uniref:hypothetical protein n=1 Tax=Streptomyces sp. NPDC048483 TaxID=3154927 RepID=UPI00342EFFEC